MKPSIGRIVLFCIGKASDGKPVLRPADVVQDWGTGEHPNLVVKLDGSNDVRYRQQAEAELSQFKLDHPGVLTGEAFGTEEDAAKYSDLSRTVDHAPSEAECGALHAWRTSVDEGEAIGTWRWPPRVG